MSRFLDGSLSEIVFFGEIWAVEQRNRNNAGNFVKAEKLAKASGFGSKSV